MNFNTDLIKLKAFSVDSGDCTIAAFAWDGWSNESEILKRKVGEERSLCEVQSPHTIKKAILLLRRRILIRINERRRTRSRGSFPFLWLPAMHPFRGWRWKIATYDSPHRFGIRFLEEMQIFYDLLIFNKSLSYNFNNYMSFLNLL